MFWEINEERIRNDWFVGMNCGINSEELCDLRLIWIEITLLGWTVGVHYSTGNYFFESK